MSGFNPPSPFEAAANQFTNPQQTPDYEFASANMADSQSLMAETGQAQKPQDQAIHKLALNFDKSGKGTVDLKLSQQAAQTLQEMLNQAQTTNKATDLLIRQYAAKRDVMQKHPIIAQLGKYASLAATAYQAPGSRGEGLVRAAGAYGGDYFKDNPEELQAKIAGAERSKMENLLPIQQAISQDRRLNEAERRDIEAATRDQRRLDIQEGEHFDIPYNISAGQGEYVSGSYTSGAQTMVDKGIMTKADVARKEASLQAQTLGYDKRVQAEAESKRKALEAEINLRQSSAAAERAAKLKESRAYGTLSTIQTIDKQIYDAVDAQQKAEAFFAGTASQFGMEPPKTRDEAQGLINKIAAMKPDLVNVTPESKAQLLNAAYGQMAALDADVRIDSLKQARAASVKGLPKDYEGTQSLEPHDDLDLKFFKANNAYPTPSQRSEYRQGLLMAATDKAAREAQANPPAAAPAGAKKGLDWKNPGGFANYISPLAAAKAIARVYGDVRTHKGQRIKVSPELMAKDIADAVDPQDMVKKAHEYLSRLENQAGQIADEYLRAQVR